MAQKCTLKVTVTGIEENEGKVLIGIFDSPKNFPVKSENNMGIHIDVVDSLVEHTFTNLKKGQYALAIYHDENSNGELDKNFLGMPTEDYVFSNYARRLFGPPSFEEASFILNDSLHIELDLQH
jgi:uncharacterized protein (DUF2141 family)